MLVEEICASLEYSTGKFPREALIEAIRTRDEIAPRLLRFIVYARENAEEIRMQETEWFMGHIYALFLLAQFREQSAYAPIVDLFASVPDKTIHDITGDVITEDLHRILPSVYSGDDVLIRKLAEGEKVPPYVRGAAVQSFATMVATGLKTRREVLDYYTYLFKGGLRRKPSFVWNSLVACTADLNPRELYEEICRAHQEMLFETGFVSIREIEREKALSIERSIENLPKHGKNTLINDTIKEMEWWACFKDNRTKQRSNPDKDFSRELKPFQTEPKTGRNEPCPCGSGKKYKKCCGKNV